MVNRDLIHFNQPTLLPDSKYALIHQTVSHQDLQAHVPLQQAICF